MATWTAEALELWQDLVSEFGNEYSYGAGTYPCVLNPVKQGFGMTQTSYNAMADTIIDTLRSDCVTSGLYAIVQENPTKRPIVSVNGIDYDLLSIENDDDTQPSIRIFAAKHQ